jgi:hypothetical protein
MAFGQAAGPPASAKQIAYLESLLKQAGHESFREARHPLGLTQRQAGGKFSKQEASELIDRLQGEGGEVTTPRLSVSPGQLRLSTAPSTRSEDRAAERLQNRRDEAVAALPTDDLAAELTRRGWTCTPPPST